MYQNGRYTTSTIFGTINPKWMPYISTYSASDLQLTLTKQIKKICFATDEDCNLKLTF